MSEFTFHKHLSDLIEKVFRSKDSFIIWCDPNGKWDRILEKLNEEEGYELWDYSNEHELLLRIRFSKEERNNRIIYLNKRQDEITWFKVFEKETGLVYQKSVIDELRDYGITISQDDEEKLSPSIQEQVLVWFDESRDVWKELTPGSMKETLIQKDKMLEILAGEQGAFEKLKKQKRWDLFIKRCDEDFGWPDPSNMTEEEWRIETTACLICTEAAKGSPNDKPSEGTRIIPQKNMMQIRAIELLRKWQRNIDLMNSFEILAPKADKRTSLSFWARNLHSLPKSYSSKQVEEVLFEKIVDELEKIEDIDLLCSELELKLKNINSREEGFWEKHTIKKIGWSYLTKLAMAASFLMQSNKVENKWKTTKDAIEWFTNEGYNLDIFTEALFDESTGFPNRLNRIRARLKRGYLRTTDRIGCAFSSLLDSNKKVLNEMNTPGELLKMELENEQKSTAIIYLDGFRYDLGEQLKDELNNGEPEKRAVNNPCISMVPTITATGMAFALPTDREDFSIQTDKDFIYVSINGFSGDLKIADNRRKYLKSEFGVKEFYTTKEILSGDNVKKSSRSNRLIVIMGDLFDKTGHDDQLDLIGFQNLLDRYVRTVKKLREYGMSRIFITTDHGFFQWDPEKDEVESDKPTGEIIWSCRRAIIGRNLKHKTGLQFNVPGSDLEVVVPRSVNSFKTYGGLGFFHGGSTLQEMIIPFISVNYPEKAIKTSVVLKPIENITTIEPRLQVEAGGQMPIDGVVDSNLLSRRVIVKINDVKSGDLIFKSIDPVTVEPKLGPINVQLRKTEAPTQLSFGDILIVQIVDYETEEILDQREVTLRVDMDDEF